MRRIGLILMAILLVVFPVFSQNVYLPDSALLYGLIKSGADTNKDGQISHAEAETVSSINALYFRNPPPSINMTGLEAFINLDTLAIWGVPVYKFDLSKNTKLKFLLLVETDLTSLDLTYNTTLELLCSRKNDIYYLDISKNNALTSLNLSSNPNLIEVCVWKTPFPPEGVLVDTTGSPNVTFTSDCSK